jgi:hypothetical protein
MNVKVHQFGRIKGERASSLILDREGRNQEKIEEVRFSKIVEIVSPVESLFIRLSSKISVTLVS